MAGDGAGVDDVGARDVRGRLRAVLTAVDGQVTAAAVDGLVERLAVEVQHLADVGVVAARSSWHVIELDDDTWRLLHPKSCWLVLSSCPLGRVDVPPRGDLVSGRYRCLLDPAGSGLVFGDWIGPL